MTETGQELYRAFVNGAFAAQEQNIKLAWGLIGGSVEVLSRQAEASRVATRTFFEQSQKQWEAWQTLAGGPFSFYAPFLYPAFRSQPRTNGREPKPPIENYDELTVEEVNRKLKELNPDEVEELKAYEQENKNRAVLLERLDRSLV